MFTPGLILLGLFTVLTLTLDFAFVRRREQDPREKRARLLQTTWLVASAATVVFFPSEGWGMTVYGVCSLGWLATSVADARLGVDWRRPSEQALRATLFLLQPLVLIGLVAFWRFIDGAGFFVGMVLPFKTDYLRPLCTGFLVATVTTLTLQATLVFRVRRANVLLLSLPLPVPSVSAPVGEFSVWPRAC